MERPIIAVTMGDAAGIGPELIMKVLSQESSYQQCRPFVIGDLAVMQQIGQALQSDLRFHPIDNLLEASFARGTVEVLPPEGLRLDKVTWGLLDQEMGHAAALCMKKAMELGQTGQVHGMVSAPMNKEAFHLAGYDYLDELAYLTELTNSHDTFIAGLVGSLWTATVTEHIAFRDVADLIKRDRVLHSIHRLSDLLQGVGRSKARIAVAALNPHGGEGGLFGAEEIDEIAPAVKAAQQEGIDARGPFPADTIFVNTAAKGFDGVLSMYHDQANIARKLLGTWEGATIFVGLPIICATTAHGTAFDKAGQGLCDPGSLRTALECVAALASAETAHASFVSMNAGTDIDPAPRG